MFGLRKPKAVSKSKSLTLTNTSLKSNWNFNACKLNCIYSHFKCVAHSYSKSIGMLLTSKQLLTTSYIPYKKMFLLRYFRVILGNSLPVSEVLLSVNRLRTGARRKWKKEKKNNNISVKPNITKHFIHSLWYSDLSFFEVNGGIHGFVQFWNPYRFE